MSALATSCAAVLRPSLVVHEVAGVDATAFLHRVLSQDVKSLAVGRARRAVLCSPRGKCLMDPVVLRLADRFLLVLDARAAAGGIPALARFVIADDVSVSPSPAPWRVLLLAGPEAPAALSRGGIPAPEPGAFAAADAFAAGAMILRRDLGSVPAFDVLLPEFAAGRGLTGVPSASEEEYDALRVETGTPAWGAEVDDRVLPTEAGLEGAISWTKGCYVGQEAVVMARHRGHPPTLLARLALSGDVLPPAGTALLSGGVPCGRLTTVARGLLRPGLFALGFVRHDLAKPGALLSVEGPSPTSATLEVLLAR